jgi:dTDP-4-amino-4,6-dideoxygalactose transaminase
LYVIRAKKRNELANYLKEAGIETAIHYPTALPNLPAYRYLGWKENDFPIASKYQEEILSLPMYPELSENMISYISKKIKQFYSK